MAVVTSNICSGDGFDNNSVRPSAEYAQIWCGVEVECEFVYPACPPPWLDTQLYHRGIQFVRFNLIGIMMSNGEALVSGLCIPSFYQALTFSGETNSKRAALVRYRDTAFHIFGKWYNSKPWLNQTEGSSSLRKVTEMHRRVAQRIRKSKDEFESIVESKCGVLEPQAQADILFDELSVLRSKQSFAADHSKFTSNSLRFTQFDMFLVQYSFFGGILLFPEWYGCSGASEDDLRGFLHVWRVFGYYLGIHDRYNGAQFDVETTVRLGREFLERIIKPCCLHIHHQTIFLGQKIFLDPSDYYVWIYRNYSMMGLRLNKLWSSFSVKQKYWYYVRCIFGSYVYPVFLIKPLLNRLASHLLNKVMQRVEGTGNTGVQGPEGRSTNATQGRLTE